MAFSFEKQQINSKRWIISPTYYNMSGEEKDLFCHDLKILKVRWVLISCFMNNIIMWLQNL